jgi:hypothetical protein
MEDISDRGCEVSKSLASQERGVRVRRYNADRSCLVLVQMSSFSFVEYVDGESQFVS